MYTDRRLVDAKLTCQNIEPENELPTVIPLLLSSRESSCYHCCTKIMIKIHELSDTKLNSSNDHTLSWHVIVRTCHVIPWIVRMH